MLIVQNRNKPAAMRHAIVDLLKRDIRVVRIASAYITTEGSKVIYDAIERCVGRSNAPTIRKEIVASLEFGITEPEALDWWRRLPNSIVYVAGADDVERGRLIPTEAAFHPKVYSFQFRNGHSNLLSGSPNMTGRGLSANTEAALVLKDVSADCMVRTFEALRENTRVLDDALLGRYRALRRRQPPPRRIRVEIEPLPDPDLPPAADVALFGHEIEEGRLRPRAEDQMWIEARRLEGGSGNQLELPRGAHEFFGLDFDNYDYPRKTTIGRPVLVAGRVRWRDRILSWHGDNKMERMNLPTAARGGFRYRDSLVLFRRRPHNQFELVVAPKGSDLERAWREAAARCGKLYRVGSRTRRLAGFLN